MREGILSTEPTPSTAPSTRLFTVVKNKLFPPSRGLRSNGRLLGSIRVGSDRFNGKDWTRCGVEGGWGGDMSPTHVSGRGSFQPPATEVGSGGRVVNSVELKELWCSHFPETPQVLPTWECICCFPSDYNIIHVYKTD